MLTLSRRLASTLTLPPKIFDLQIFPPVLYSLPLAPESETFLVIATTFFAVLQSCIHILYLQVFADLLFRINQVMSGVELSYFVGS